MFSIPQQELEQRTSQPRDEEKAVADEDWEPKQENIIQTIYAENQRKAEAAHKTLSKCGAQNILVSLRPSDLWVSFMLCQGKNRCHILEGISDVEPINNSDW